MGSFLCFSKWKWHSDERLPKNSNNPLELLKSIQYNVSEKENIHSKSGCLKS